jgi:hypothetical protein
MANLARFSVKAAAFPKKLKLLPKTFERFRHLLELFPQTLDRFLQTLECFPQRLERFRQTFDLFWQSQWLCRICSSFSGKDVGFAAKA